MFRRDEKTMYDRNFTLETKAGVGGARREQWEPRGCGSQFLTGYFRVFT